MQMMIFRYGCLADKKDGVNPSLPDGCTAAQEEGGLWLIHTSCDWARFLMNWTMSNIHSILVTFITTILQIIPATLADCDLANGIITLLFDTISTMLPSAIQYSTKKTIRLWAVRLNLRRYRGIQKIWKSYRWMRICKFSRQKCRIYKFSRQKLRFWTTWQKPSVWL